MHTLTRSRSIAVAALAALLVGVSALFALQANAAPQPELTVSIVDGNNATTTSAAIGSAVHPRVLVASTTGAVPTGTADFTMFSGTSCSGTATVQQDIPLVNGIANGSTTTVPSSGLSYVSHYDGDTNNVSADSVCIAVIPTSSSTSINTTLSTTSAQAGASVFDAATLVGVTSNASGTVSYTVFTNNSCSAGARPAGSKSVSNAAAPNSDTLVFSTPGTYYWQATYSGDSQNAPATSTCTNEVLTIAATTSPATTTGRIIVDKVTIPSGSTTTFQFSTGGAGYSSFSLTDAASPNNQVLNPGNYSITEQSMQGWSLVSATCSRNTAGQNNYTPGTTFALYAGDTVVCTFTNKQNATSTGNQGHGHDDDDDDHDEGHGHGNNGHDRDNHGRQVSDFVHSLNKRIHDRLDSAMRAHGLR